VDAWCALVALTLFGALACSRARPDATVATADTAAAEILWLPEHAVLEPDAARPVTIKNGRSIYVDGSGAVVFRIAVKCDDVAKDIGEHFAQTEWRPRSTQYLNPQVATSFNSGCRPHGGGVIRPGSVIPPEPFIEWRGDWENGRGDIVTYAVGGTGPHMHGYAAYIPRDVVESGWRKLGR
jgi:hypothetical protein